MGRIDDIILAIANGTSSDQLPPPQSRNEALLMAILDKVNNIRDGEIAEAVSNWLAAHVDPDTGYVIDDSLTVEGAAADAKAVGDAIADFSGDYVKYVAQTLTDAQKEQARENIGAGSEEDVSDLKSAINDPVTGLDTKAPAIVDTASGAIASFPDGMAAPAKDVTIDIEPVQSGSGDPSPENVRPITGWTGANVTRTGKNLLDISKQPDFQSGPRSIVNNGDGSITVTLDANTSAGNITLRDLIGEVALGKICTLSANTTGSNKYIYLYGINETWRFGAAKMVTKEALDSIVLWYASGANTTATISNIQVELGSTVTDYEPFGKTYPITFPSEAGTVYGGTLDVTTGLLTVTMAEVDLGTINWFSNSETVPDIFRSSIDRKFGFGNFNMVCSKYITYTGNNSTGQNIEALVQANGNGLYVNGGSATFYIADSAYTNADAFKAAMSGVQLVYELATPQTYQLTPTEVTLLLGDNNVWADTGDSTVTYRADTKLYIQKINTPTDDDMIADAQIASGKYFIIGGNLYKSTTTIPAGDTITPGTNCILTNLADALNALNT